MKRIALFIAAGIFLFTSAASAQGVMTEDGQQVKVLSYKSKKVGEKVELDFNINYDKVLLAPNEKLVITPYITDGEEMIKLHQVVFMGERCFHQQNREHKSHGEFHSYAVPFQEVVLTKKDMRERRRALRKNNYTYDVNSPRTVKYEGAFTYDRWMDGADVYMHHEVLRCHNNMLYKWDSKLGVLLNPLPPQVTFLVPDIEKVKARSESMTARIVFEVNKTDIKRGLYGNDVELDNIYKFTDKIINNKDLEINRISLKGYASPEGNYKHNADLAQGRTKALESHLQSKYTSVGRNIYSTSSVAEDWDSVRRYVAASDMKFRTQVLDIIDNTEDPDKRDAKIRALDRSVTYNTLLKEVYPGLRRVDYTINYTIVPFTVAEGKNVIHTTPQYLSLNELYQIAETYSMDSKEYREVFEIAVRYYPNDPVANNNMAAIALLDGDMEKAHTYLNKVADYPGAQNNLGVYYAIEGDYEAAEAAFRKAVKAGNKEAEYNLQNIGSLRW